MGLWSFLDDVLTRGKEKIGSLLVKELDVIPLEDEMALEVGMWYRIKDVVSLYIDMEDSTELTNENYINVSAKIHQLFTGSLIDILKEFGARFIDIKGDGGFALWKEQFGSVKALLAGVTFKTSVEKNLQSYVKSQITNWKVSSKIGIVKGTVLVKKVGTRDTQDKKFNWAVWVGKPVSLSAKLSDIANSDTVLVTENVFSDFSIPLELRNYLIMSCGCPHGTKVNLWQERIDLKDKFSMKIFELKSKWCDIHGQDYLNNALKIINK